MIYDHILEELRQFKEEYAAKFNYDLAAIFDDLKKAEKCNGHQLVSFKPKPYIPPLKRKIQENPCGISC